MGHSASALWASLLEEEGGDVYFPDNTLEQLPWKKGCSLL